MDEHFAELKLAFEKKSLKNEKKKNLRRRNKNINRNIQSELAPTNEWTNNNLNLEIVCARCFYFVSSVVLLAPAYRDFNRPIRKVMDSNQLKVNWHVDSFVRVWVSECVYALCAAWTRRFTFKHIHDFLWILCACVDLLCVFKNYLFLFLYSSI